MQQCLNSLLHHTKETTALLTNQYRHKVIVDEKTWNQFTSKTKLLSHVYWMVFYWCLRATGSFNTWYPRASEVSPVLQAGLHHLYSQTDCWWPLWLLLSHGGITAVISVQITTPKCWTALWHWNVICWPSCSSPSHKGVHYLWLAKQYWASAINPRFTQGKGQVRVSEGFERRSERGTVCKRPSPSCAEEIIGDVLLYETSLPLPF